MTSYIFDNAAQQASQRFNSLETLFDAWTIRHLEATGIGSGWQCWEVGGGSGSIAAWLSQRSGPSGHVLVTDIDPRPLTGLVMPDHSFVEIQRHDIATDPLPARTFDLIHARLVLVHVPAREQALQRMVSTLSPGGWLVLDDFDLTLLDAGYPTTDAGDATLYQKWSTALLQRLRVRGGEITASWGRTLYQRLRAQGLVDVGMEGYMAVWEGRSPGARLMQANIEQIWQESVSAGLITDEEIERLLALLDDPGFAFGSPVMCTAWGHRP